MFAQLARKRNFCYIPRKHIISKSDGQGGGWGVTHYFGLGYAFREASAYKRFRAPGQDGITFYLRRK